MRMGRKIPVAYVSAQEALRRAIREAYARICNEVGGVPDLAQVDHVSGTAEYDTGGIDNAIVSYPSGYDLVKKIHRIEWYVNSRWNAVIVVDPSSIRELYEAGTSSEQVYYGAIENLTILISPAPSSTLTGSSSLLRVFADFRPAIPSLDAIGDALTGVFDLEYDSLIIEIGEWNLFNMVQGVAKQSMPADCLARLSTLRSQINGRRGKIFSLTGNPPSSFDYFNYPG